MNFLFRFLFLAIPAFSFSQPPVMYLSADSICINHCIFFNDSTVTAKPCDYEWTFPGGVPYACTGCIISGDTVRVTLSSNATPYPPTVKVCYHINSQLNPGGCFPVIESITQSSTTYSTQTCVHVFSAPLSNSGQDTTVCVGGTIHLHGSGSMGSPSLSYAWSGPNGFTSSLANPTITNATFANSGRYDLTVSTSLGCWSVDSVFITVGCVGIKEATLQKEISIFPNPSNGEFTILSSELIEELKISDVFGQIISAATPRAEKFTCQITQRGIYSAAIKTKSGISIRKIAID